MLILVMDFIINLYYLEWSNNVILLFWESKMELDLMFRCIILLE